jgi:Xaa-Pro aminopeptidase
MSHAPSAILERRHAEVRKAFLEQSLDALVVTSLPNILYLTNFTGSAAIAIVTRSQLLFITDSRYLTAIADSRGTAHECPGLQLDPVDSSYDETLVSVLSGMTTALPIRVGFEAAHLSVARHTWLRRRLRGAAAPELIEADTIVERARIRKDEYEVRVLREAARRLSAVAATVLGDIRVGRTERDIASIIDARLRDEGFDKPAFDTIAASGPNAALPHARPGERKLAEGDLVVLDFGGVYDSYCVDLTRTVSVGPAAPRARAVYDAVLTAHDRAIAAVKPGVPGYAIDAAARDTLAGAGMAEAFGHGTGHGLGIEVHEEPRISRRRSEAETAAAGVLPGMVFTIEPGAYFPGWGGVRIEDDVLVTDDGVEVLTDVTTELLEV